MTTGVKNYAKGAIEAFYYARLDTATETYPHGTSGAITNGSDAGMAKYKGFATLAETPATGENQPIQGDAGRLGTMFVRSIDDSTGTLTTNTYDSTFHITAENMLVYTDGDYEFQPVNDDCTELNPLCFLINGHATSLEAASLNEKGWYNRIIFRSTAEKTDESFSGTEFTAQAQAWNLIFEEAANDLFGRAITLANYNRTKLRAVEYWSENPVHIHTFMGDGAATTVTLDETPAAANGDKVQVYVDGVAQTYTTAFTVNTATKVLTFEVGSVPAAGENVIIRYEYTPSC